MQKDRNFPAVGGQKEKILKFQNAQKEIFSGGESCSMCAGHRLPHTERGKIRRARSCFCGLLLPWMPSRSMRRRISAAVACRDDSAVSPAVILSAAVDLITLYPVSVAGLDLLTV